ncbi:MAG TPA: glycosyltransferase family 2 protein [Patescibacteria group bacterium]|nr:glycosyltransferase family 2 protein [Patescibacteria group bacterium]
MKKINSLSIFFPFWNEEKNIEPVISKALEVAPTVAREWEIIIVDDGSSDRTLKEAEKIAKTNKCIRVISHNPNRGYGAALKEGFENARFDVVAFTDGDGQFDFSEIVKFVENIENVDMVIGYRKRREDKFFRHILMNMLKIWDYAFFGFWFKDIDCGFKMFKKRALSEIMPLRSEGAMITTEILAKSVRKKLRIKEVEVTHYPRQFGQQTGANFPVIVRAVLESLILWYDIHNGRI